MSPLPPFDLALPALPILLDETALIPLVTGALEPAEGFAITRCRPRYARYKPGTSCLVLYELTFRSSDGDTTTRTMHIHVYADDRGKRRATSAKMRRLLETASGQRDSVTHRTVAYLSDLDGLLQAYPIDYDLRYLVQASNPDTMTGVFRTAQPEFNDLTVSDTPELLRYKPARKALLRYPLDDGPTGHLYGKLTSSNRIPVLQAQTEALIEAGVMTPSILVAQPEHGYVAHEEAAGIQLASLRGQADYTGWMEPLAQSLIHLQSVDIPGLVHRLSDEATVIRNGANWLARVTPHLAGRLARISEQIVTSLARIDERYATCHGDFYDDQAIVSGNGVTIIDLDELRCGHPLLDAGNMLAHLTSGHEGPNTTNFGSARDAFLAGIQRQMPFSASDIALFEASALMKLAPGPFRRLEPGWPDAIERILSLAEMRLAEREPANASHSPQECRAFHAPNVVDPALPQLETLQDTSIMSMKLAHAMNKRPVKVADIAVVRHKPGRRAILRYHLHDDAADAGMHVYAKTFASSRGPQVHEITRAITAAKGFGSDVALPDPIAFLPDLKLLVQSPVPGVPIEGALLNGETALVVRIATALHRFHMSGLDLGRTHEVANEMEPLELRVRQVIDFCPDLQGLAESCLECIRRTGTSEMIWRHQPVHRDFYHDQVLIDGNKLAVLDLDDASMSEPTVDVANFAAHLMLLGAQKFGSVSALEPITHAFVERYIDLDSGFDPCLFRFLTASTMVRLAGIHVGRHSGDRIARELLRASSGLLKTWPSS